MFWEYKWKGNTFCKHAKRLDTEYRDVNGYKAEGLLLVLIPLCKSYFNPFTPSGLFYHNSLDWSISNRRVVCLVFFLLSQCFIELFGFNANSVDPDQTFCGV